MENGKSKDPLRDETLSIDEVAELVGYTQLVSLFRRHSKRLLVSLHAFFENKFCRVESNPKKAIV